MAKPLRHHGRREGVLDSAGPRTWRPSGGPLLRNNGPHLRPRRGGNNERDIRLLPRCSRGSYYLRAKVDAVLDERRPGEEAPGASLSTITSNLVDPSRRGRSRSCLKYEAFSRLRENSAFLANAPYGDGAVFRAFFVEAYMCGVN